MSARGYRAPGGTAEVAEQIGVTVRQLDSWVSVGYVRPGNGRRGRPRTWPEPELRIAALMVRLSAAGMVLEVAASVARSVVAFGLAEVDLGDGITLKIGE